MAWTPRIALAACLLLSAGLARAGDRLPGVAADSMYRAEALLKEKGDDPAAAEAALAMLDEHKEQAVSSARFWTAYAGAWKAAGRDEALFWSSIIAPLQAAHPKSPTFDLVRARMATDPKVKRKYVDAAIQRHPSGIEARVMLARLYLAEDNLDDADVLLDELLEEAPEDRGVLLAKGEIYIHDGMGKSAGRIADRGIEAWGEDPAFYALKARAAKLMARHDSKHLSAAREAAVKAVSLHPTSENVDTLIEVLKALGEHEEAARVLDEQFRRTGDAELGAMLGREAFVKGDYPTAIRSMAGAREKITFAKGYAVALARTAQTELAKAAIADVLKREPKWVAQARDLLFLAGDAAGAAAIAPTGEVHERMAAAHIAAWSGDAAAVLRLMRQTLKDGSRKSEEALLLLLSARVLEAMGAERAEALRKHIVTIRGKINKRPRPLPTPPGFYAGGKAKHEAYAVRAVTYFLTPDGHAFEPEGDVVTTSSWTMGNMRVFTSSGYWRVTGRSVVDPEYKRQFRFNQTKSKTNVIELRPVDQDPPKPDDKDGTKKEKPKTFEDAIKHFDLATAAVVEADYDKALEELDAACNIEPHWARAVVLRAAVRALGGAEPERAMAGREARRIHTAYADDLRARQLAVFLDAWAGVDVEEDVRDIEKHRAERTQRNIEKL